METFNIIMVGLLCISAVYWLFCNKIHKANNCVLWAILLVLGELVRKI